MSLSQILERVSGIGGFGPTGLSGGSMTSPGGVTIEGHLLCSPVCCHGLAVLCYNRWERLRDK